MMIENHGIEILMENPFCLQLISTSNARAWLVSLRSVVDSKKESEMHAFVG